MQQGAVRAGPWRQLIDEMARPATFSSWRTEVSALRIREIDRIRPFVTRAVLVLGMLGCLVVLGDVRPWAWPLLGIPLLQTTLEIWLEDKTRDVAHRKRESEKVILRPLMDMWYRNREIIRVNATGLLGVLSCVAIGIISLFGTGGTPEWVRVMLFALAVLFINSALLGPLLDVATFSANSKSGPVMRVMTYWWWLVVLAVLVIFVLIAHATGFWPDGSVPYALGVTTLTYAIGLRQRTYERDMDAGALATQRRARRENQEIRRFLHDICQPVKEVAERSDRGEALTPEDVTGLKVFMATIKETLRRAREQEDERLELPGLDAALELIASSAWFRPKITRDTEALSLLHEDDGPLADGLLMTLLFNSLQAYESLMTAWRKSPREERPPRPGAWIALSVRVDRDDLGTDRILLSVSDGLPLVPDHLWNGSPTLTSRRRAVTSRGGDLVQEPIDPTDPTAGKSVVARWPLKPVREIDRKD